jgi:hypothetical protein
MTWLRHLVALACVGTVAISASPAYAEDCQVVEIEASNTQSPSVDAALGDLAKKLGKMPFSAFNTFKQSARQSRAMAAGSSQSFNVTHGTVDVAFDKVIAATKKKKKRFSLGVAITASGKSARWVDTKSSVDTGDFLMFARTVDSSSGIIYAVGCH